MRHRAACCAVLAGVLSAMLTPLAHAVEHYTDHVDPFIGTDGTGHTTPAASLPFGMVAPGPDNAAGGWDYSSGYQYRAPKILGFSNTHISGAGIPELGDVLLQPVQGTPWSQETADFSSRYDKASETAHPGYYAVTLRDHGVRVELAALQRVALHRYTFRRGGRVQVLVDLQHGLQFGDAPRVTASDVQADALRGEVRGTVHTKGWVERQASFVVRFDQPAQSVQRLATREGEMAPRYLLTFALGRQRTLQAQVAMSTVDVDGARRNLEAVQGVGFDAARRDADRQWNALLGRITIEAPAHRKRTFYTALYHALLHPSDIADVDGRVRGPDGTVLQARGGHYYSTLSLWDTFRGVHPLFTLLVPERVDGFVLSLLDHHRAMGYLPLWTAWGRETWTMIGNPALPVIADAVAKDFHGFDHGEALAAMLQTSTARRENAPAWAQRDWADYEQFGYMPFDRSDGESVSKTLEYGIGDAALAQVAAALKQDEIAARFAKRAQGYHLLFDAQTGMMRGRSAAGEWRTPFDPVTPTSPMNNPGDYTEANAWQYTLTPALHDPQGLVRLMGGPKAFGDWLDRFFSVQAPGDNRHLGQEAMIGQYSHGNEPSHHIAYLYAYSDRPWKGHAMIRRIVREFYGLGHGDIQGNDDCGQMSAWYVLSTLGFYPVVPGSGEFVAGAPQVRVASLQLGSGAALRIEASAFSERNLVADQVRLEGRVLDPKHLRYADLMQGGQLRFSMVPLPD